MDFIAALTTKHVALPADRAASVTVGWAICLTLLAALMIYRRHLSRLAVGCYRSLRAKTRTANPKRSDRSTMRQRLELEVSALRDELAQMEAGLSDVELGDRSEGFKEMRASLDYLARQVEGMNR
ncbi:MAG: hypothetical protein WD648_10210 [Planctomycetaceae bacterium]